MAAKRPLEEDSSAQPAKKKKGISVGPQNLPDGTYRRKGILTEDVTLIAARADAEQQFKKSSVTLFTRPK